MGVWTVEGPVWSFESVQPLTDFQDFLDSSYFYFCWSGSAYIPLNGDPETDFFLPSAAERKIHCYYSTPVFLPRCQRF